MDHLHTLRGRLAQASAMLALIGCVGLPSTSSADHAARQSPPSRDTTRFAAVTAGKSPVFPRDYGAHPDFRTEWW